MEYRTRNKAYATKIKTTAEALEIAKLISDIMKMSARSSLPQCIESSKWLLFCLRCFDELKKKLPVQRVCQAVKVTNTKSKCESFFFDYTEKVEKTGTIWKSQDKLKSFTFKSCIGSIS